MIQNSISPNIFADIHTLSSIWDPGILVVDDTSFNQRQYREAIPPTTNFLLEWKNDFSWYQINHDGLVMPSDRHSILYFANWSIYSKLSRGIDFIATWDVRIGIVWMYQGSYTDITSIEEYRGLDFTNDSKGTPIKYSTVTRGIINDIGYNPQVVGYYNDISKINTSPIPQNILLHLEAYRNWDDSSIRIYDDMGIYDNIFRFVSTNDDGIVWLSNLGTYTNIIVKKMRSSP